MTYKTARRLLDQLDQPSSIQFKRLNLDRVRALLAQLGNPQNSYPIVHIAGTSGKGSVATMISSIVNQAGYRAGVFSQPYLETPREEFRLNNRLISTNQFAQVFGKVYPIARMVRATYFETMTAIALVYFQERKVDLAIVEVGMGGQFDATNVVRPILSVITPIGLDHTKALGKSLAKIAQAKAGIIKPGLPVVIGPQKKSVESVLISKAKLVRAPVSKAVIKTNYKLRLPGQFQQVNCSIAVRAAHKLKQARFRISKQAIKTGLARAFLAGRFEIIGRVILDGAHNPDKMRALCLGLKIMYPGQKFIVVFGVKKDKNVRAMIRQIRPLAKLIIGTKITDQRFKFYDPSQISSVYKNNPIKAYQLGKRLLDRDTMLLITGSLYLVGELRHVVLRRAKLA